MSKRHDVQDLTFAGDTLVLVVDGQRYEFALAEISARLAGAPVAARRRYEVSPTGYGIHWPEVDEDLSVDGLLRHYAAKAVA